MSFSFGRYDPPIYMFTVSALCPRLPISFVHRDPLALISHLVRHTVGYVLLCFCQGPMTYLFISLQSPEIPPFIPDLVRLGTLLYVLLALALYFTQSYICSSFLLICAYQSASY
jgi:hypothetical protein